MALKLTYDMFGLMITMMFVVTVVGWCAHQIHAGARKVGTWLHRSHAKGADD